MVLDTPTKPHPITRQGGGNTMYAEVIYETGSHSVVSVDNLEELKEGLLNQHNRAREGAAGGPAMHSAERVKKVLLYKEHPADYNAGGLLPVNTIKDVVEGIAMGGEVSIEQLRNALVVAAQPIKSLDEISSPHDSIFRAKESSELDLGYMKGQGA